MYAKIIIDQDAKALDKVFEYVVPADMDISIGMRVYVPFGKRILQGGNRKRGPGYAGSEAAL